MNSRKSLFTLLFIVATLLVIRLGFMSWRNVLSWDNFGYYLYLPAEFIYDEIALKDQSWLEVVIKRYKPTSTFYQGVELPDGKWVMRYPMGLAILNAPFFFAAHVLAPVLDYPSDGFSKPYQVAWVCGGLFYAILGFWFFRKILLHYFSDALSSVLLVLVLFGTNLLEQVTKGNGHVHNYLFCLFALVFWLTISWHKKPGLVKALLMGVLCGLMAICRPTEILILLIPVLYGVYNWPSFKDKFMLLLRKWYHVILLGAGVLIGSAPQLLYWFELTGKPLFYSYEDPAVGFSFYSPYLKEFLFSYRKGWFLYTPVMLFAVVGFIALWKRQRALFFPALLYTGIAVYIAASWSVWWYAGGSYSSRSMISAYSLLAIPLGCLIEEAGRKKWLKYSLSGLLTFFVFLNLFQFWQFEQRILDRVRMTKAYYWKHFLKTRVEEKDKSLLLVQRSEEAYEYMPADIPFKRTLLIAETYDSAKKEDWRIVEDPVKPGNKVLLMDSSFIYTPSYDESYRNLVRDEYAWVRVRCRVFVDSADHGFPVLVVHFAHKDKAYKYVTTENQIPNLKKGQWQEITMDYMTPEVRSEEDKMRVYIWNFGNGKVLVDDFSIEHFEPVKQD